MADDTDWVRGPGRQHHGRGPVPEAYAETNALEHQCPNCGAAVDEFCTHPGGVQRRMPCPKRLPHNPEPEGDDD